MKHVPPPAGTPIAGPELTPDEIKTRLATQERQRERALRRLRKLRERARNEIDRLLEFLDASDIDPDLEPSLAIHSAYREAAADECEIPEDAEPSLGSFDRMIDQDKSYRAVVRNPDVFGWPSGADNEQDDCDYEPALGSSDQHDDQTAWADGGRLELELDGAESGIGDADGLLEQVGSQDWQQGGMG